MAKREHIGVSLHGSHIRIAVIETTKRLVVVKRLITAELPTGTSPASSSASDAEPAGLDDIDDLLFGEESDKADRKEKTESEEWDMTEDGVGESFQADTGELLIANLLAGFNPKSATVGLTVPAGQALLQIFTDSDYHKRKKKDIQSLIHDRLFSTYGRDITPDNYGHFIRDADGALVLCSMEGQNTLLNLFDNALPLYPGKLTIKDVKPEELYLVALVRANYTLLENEYTVLIHITETQSHLIILHGTLIVGILPVISEGSRSNRVMKTIFSKILFELDRGQLPTIDRIILTGDDAKGKAISFLEEQFMEVQIGRLQFDPMKVAMPEGFTEDPTPYATAIAAAWSASGRDPALFPKISLIPSYVATRQAVFKLEWHGYLLLLLIAAFPFFFNQRYQTKAVKAESLRSEIVSLNQQISENRVLASVVDQMNAEIGGITVNTNLLDTLAKNTHLWSYTLSMMNAQVADMRGVWIQYIQYDENSLVLKGYSLSRERIPRVSNLFHRSVIQQVLEVEERNTKFYEFHLQVHSITVHSELISPLPVEPPRLDLLGLERPGTTGIIRN